RPTFCNPRRGVMPARNAGVLVARKSGGDNGGSRRRGGRIRPWTGTIFLLLASALTPLASAQGQGAPADQTEVQQLRKEVNDLRESLRRVEALLEAKHITESSTTEAAAAPSAAPAPAAQPPVTPSAPSVQAQTPRSREPAQSEGLPLYTARPDNAEVAMATKAHGGDLSGSGDLLRTERVTVGGYGDFQFRTPALNERADGGGTSTFQSTRFVLGVAAVLSQKQNITFNSEIEYELGTSEIDVEQAFVSWRVRPEFDFRGGIIVPPLGRFNTYHDSNLNITTLRPLINQFIVPTAYRDAGIGARGVFKLPRQMRISYEADVLNGMQALNADGEATPFSRLVGQSSAAEPGLIALQATRNGKAVAGRIGFSPMLGLEFGLSGYNGTFTADG